MHTVQNKIQRCRLLSIGCVGISLGLLAACGSDAESGPSAIGSNAGKDAAVEPDTSTDAASEADAARPPDAASDPATDTLSDAALETSPSPDSSDAVSDSATDRFAALTQAIEKERTKLGAPGVAVAVLEGGKVTFAQGFGSRHPEKQDPVLPTTLFRIGSTTKMITTVGLLQQVQKGKVNLDSPVTDYVSDLNFSKDASWASSIRVKHLLTHSSAMYDLVRIDWPDRNDSVLGTFLTGQFETIEYLMAPAGRMWNYSNPNFMLAGLVTERTSGSYYREYLRDNVLLPLGMNRTLFLSEEILSDGDYASGKTVDWETGNGVATAGPDSYDNPWARPAGFAWSSVLDLAKFATFLMHGQDSVLGSSLVQSMQANQVNTEEWYDHIFYGYGLFAQEGIWLGEQYFDIRLVAHGGDIPGFAADLTMIPSKDFAFISLANTDGAHFNDSLTVAMQTLVDLPDPSPNPNPAIDRSAYRFYTGDYRDDFNVGRVTVSTDDTDLFVDMPDLAKAGIGYERKLECYLQTSCILTVKQNGTSELPLTFILDEAGKGEYLRSRIFVARKAAQTDGGLGSPAIQEPPHHDLRKLFESARETERLPMLRPKR